MGTPPRGGARDDGRLGQRPIAASGTAGTRLCDRPTAGPTVRRYTVGAHRRDDLHVHSRDSRWVWRVLRPSGTTDPEIAWGRPHCGVRNGTEREQLSTPAR